MDMPPKPALGMHKGYNWAVFKDLFMQWEDPALRGFMFPRIREVLHSYPSHRKLKYSREETKFFFFSFFYHCPLGKKFAPNSKTVCCKSEQFSSLSWNPLVAQCTLYVECGLLLFFLLPVYLQAFDQRSKIIPQYDFQSIVHPCCHPIDIHILGLLLNISGRRAYRSSIMFFRDEIYNIWVNKISFASPECIPECMSHSYGLHSAYRSSCLSLLSMPHSVEFSSSSIWGMPLVGFVPLTELLCTLIFSVV